MPSPQQEPALLPERTAQEPPGRGRKEELQQPDEKFE